MKYASVYGLSHIGKPGFSYVHRSEIETRYSEHHVGDVITEMEAYDLGYVEPLVDTVAGQIAQVHARMPAASDLEFRSSLLEAELIEDGEHVSRKGSRIDVYSNQLSRELIYEDASPRNVSTHPITLLTYALKDEEMPVSASVFEPRTNRVYEFMTFVPV